MKKNYFLIFPHIGLLRNFLGYLRGDEKNIIIASPFDMLRIFEDKKIHSSLLVNNAEFRTAVLGFIIKLPVKGKVFFGIFRFWQALPPIMQEFVLPFFRWTRRFPQKLVNELSIDSSTSIYFDHHIIKKLPKIELFSERIVVCGANFYMSQHSVYDNETISNSKSQLVDFLNVHHGNKINWNDKITTLPFSDTREFKKKPLDISVYDEDLIIIYRPPDKYISKSLMFKTLYNSALVAKLKGSRIYVKPHLYGSIYLPLFVFYLGILRGMPISIIKDDIEDLVNIFDIGICFYSSIIDLFVKKNKTILQVMSNTNAPARLVYGNGVPLIHTENELGNQLRKIL